MKFSIPVTCHCGISISCLPWLRIDNLHHGEQQRGCARMDRAYAELKAKDYTLCVILSAMAVECQLAHVFFKWKKIDQQMANLNACMAPTAAQIEAWEDQCRKWSQITQKLDRDCQLFFEKTLFWRRNGVIHFARVDLGEPEAVSCLQLALTLYTLLQAADRFKKDRTFPPQQSKP